MKTLEELEAFMLKHGENIIDTLGAEVDRLEKDLKVKFSCLVQNVYSDIFQTVSLLLLLGIVYVNTRGKEVVDFNANSLAVVSLNSAQQQTCALFCIWLSFIYSTQLSESETCAPLNARVFS